MIHSFNYRKNYFSIELGAIALLVALLLTLILETFGLIVVMKKNITLLTIFVIISSLLIIVELIIIESSYNVKSFHRLQSLSVNIAVTILAFIFIIENKTNY